MLVLGLQPREQLDDEPRRAELVADQRGEKCVLAIERRRHIDAISQKRAVIVITAKGPYRAQPETRFIKPLPKA